jgi:hypothetical protein
MLPQRRLLRLAEGGSTTRPVRLKGLAWLSPFNERDVRCKQRKQRADARTRVLTAPQPNAAQFEVLLCLPTAPMLPTEGSGDFGTSPFYRQLSDKPQLIFVLNMRTQPEAQ